MTRSSTRSSSALGLQHLDDPLARLEAVEADQLLGDQAVGGLHDPGVGARAC